MKKLYLKLWSMIFLCLHGFLQGHEQSGALKSYAQKSSAMTPYAPSGQLIRNLQTGYAQPGSYQFASQSHVTIPTSVTGKLLSPSQLLLQKPVVQQPLKTSSSGSSLPVVTSYELLFGKKKPEVFEKTPQSSAKDLNYDEPQVRSNNTLGHTTNSKSLPSQSKTSLLVAEKYEFPFADYDIDLPVASVSKKPAQPLHQKQLHAATVQLEKHMDNSLLDGGDLEYDDLSDDRMSLSRPTSEKSTPVDISVVGNVGDDLGDVLSDLDALQDVLDGKKQAPEISGRVKKDPRSPEPVAEDIESNWTGYDPSHHITQKQALHQELIKRFENPGKKPSDKINSVDGGVSMPLQGSVDKVSHETLSDSIQVKENRPVGGRGWQAARAAMKDGRLKNVTKEEVIVPLEEINVMTDGLNSSANTTDKTFIAKMKHLFNKYANQWRVARGRPTVSRPELDPLADVGMTEILQLKGKATAQSIQSVFNKLYQSFDRSPDGSGDFNDYEEIVFQTPSSKLDSDMAKLFKFLNESGSEDHPLSKDPWSSADFGDEGNWL